MLHPLHQFFSERALVLLVRWVQFHDDDPFPNHSDPYRALGYKQFVLPRTVVSNRQLIRLHSCDEIRPYLAGSVGRVVGD